MGNNKEVISKVNKFFELTKGKDYKVLQESNNQYYIQGDHYLQWYRKDLFQIVKR